jgi:hypothetical protein
MARNPAHACIAVVINSPTALAFGFERRQALEKEGPCTHRLRQAISPRVLPAEEEGFTLFTKGSLPAPDRANARVIRPQSHTPDGGAKSMTFMGSEHLVCVLFHNAQFQPLNHRRFETGSHQREPKIISDVGPSSDIRRRRYQTDPSSLFECSFDRFMRRSPNGVPLRRERRVRCRKTRLVAPAPLFRLRRAC